MCESAGRLLPQGKSVEGIIAAASPATFFSPLILQASGRFYQKVRQVRQAGGRFVKGARMPVQGNRQLRQGIGSLVQGRRRFVNAIGQDVEEPTSPGAGGAKEEN